MSVEDRIKQLDKILKSIRSLTEDESISYTVEYYLCKATLEVDMAKVILQEETFVSEGEEEIK